MLVCLSPQMPPQSSRHIRSTTHTYTSTHRRQVRTLSRFKMSKAISLFQSVIKWSSHCPDQHTIGVELERCEWTDSPLRGRISNWPNTQKKGIKTVSCKIACFSWREIACHKKLDFAARWLGIHLLVYVKFPVNSPQSHKQQGKEDKKVRWKVKA